MTPAPTLSLREIAAELAPFGVELAEERLGQLSTYLELLLRWNRRINLTGLREPRLIVRRLFGESLYISRVVELHGWLVDVGSGAGFPGLALKLAAPDLRVTLIEARQRKCAFLKEVTRECGFYAVDVVCERFEAWAEAAGEEEKADCITTRAVATHQGLLQTFGGCLEDGGKLVLSTTGGDAQQVRSISSGFKWEPIAPIPNSKHGVIMVGSMFNK